MGSDKFKIFDKSIGKISCFFSKILHLALPKRYYTYNWCKNKGHFREKRPLLYHDCTDVWNKDKTYLQNVDHQEEASHSDGSEHCITHSVVCLLFKVFKKPCSSSHQQIFVKLSHRATARKIGATETWANGSRIRSQRPTSIDKMLIILPVVTLRRPSAFSLEKVSKVLELNYDLSAPFLCIKVEVVRKSRFQAFETNLKLFRNSRELNWHLSLWPSVIFSYIRGCTTHAEKRLKPP